jgi:hypothetical protein
MNSGLKPPFLCGDDEYDGWLRDGGSVVRHRGHEEGGLASLFVRTVSEGGLRRLILDGENGWNFGEARTPTGRTDPP